jgi:hypothetical protein
MTRTFGGKEGLAIDPPPGVDPPPGFVPPPGFAPDATTTTWRVVEAVEEPPQSGVPPVERYPLQP